MNKVFAKPKSNAARGHHSVPRLLFSDEDFPLKIILTSLAFSLLAASSLGQQKADPKPANSSQEAAATVPAPPAHPITADQTRELFALTGTKAMMEQMIHHTLAIQRASSPPFIPADVWTDLEESFLKVDFAQLMLPTYQKYLSEEDATRTLAFYRTEAGKHFLVVMPQVLIEAGDIGRKEGQRIASEVIQRHQQEITDAKKKYDEQQKQPEETPQQIPPSDNKPNGAGPKTPQ